jgi:predicted dehydrogenase
MFQDRVKPDIQRLKRLIDSGALGKILFVDARVKWYRPPEYYAKSKWRGTLALDGGGALMNQGVHTVDLLLWLLGDVTRVQSRIATALHKIESEDTAIAILEFASGALGSLQATTAAYPGYPRRVGITGSEGTVILEHDRIVAMDLRNPSPEPEPPEGVATDTNASASSAAVTDTRGHQKILEDFLSAIKHDTAPLCDGPQGRKSVTLIEAIYRASASHGAIVTA